MLIVLKMDIKGGLFLKLVSIELLKGGGSGFVPDYMRGVKVIADFNLKMILKVF